MSAFLGDVVQVYLQPKLQCLSLEQVEELASVLDENLEPQVVAKHSDVQAGWKLVAIGARVCKNLKDLKTNVMQPNLKNSLGPVFGLGICRKGSLTKGLCASFPLGLYSAV